MRTQPILMSTVVTAAILVGLTSVAPAANAAEPRPATGVSVTSSTATDEELSASKVDSTRQFTIGNFSGHTLTIADIWGTTGWPYPAKTGFNPYDEFPLAGSVLHPGQRMVFEIKDWADHGITVKFRSDDGRDVHVYMHVSGLSRYSDARGLEGQFVKGGGDVTIFDKPGVVAVPASDPAAQARTITALCEQSAVDCKFTPTDKKPGLLGPPHPFGRGVANLTPDPQLSLVTEGDTVETSTSLELSASIKATLFGALEAGMTTAYKQAWTATHTFVQQQNLSLRPEYVGWMTAQEPMVRVTGNLEITLPGSQTSWLVKGLVFDVPDKFATTGGGGINTFARAMTADEVKEAWRTGGFVEAPWTKGYEGVTVNVVRAPDNALTPIGDLPRAAG